MRRTTMPAAAGRLTAGCLAAVLLLSPLAAAAMGSGGSSGTEAEKPADPTWTQAQAAIRAGQYEQALPLLQQVVAKDARNADAYNYLGYASGRLGRNEPALGYYQKALALQPEHKGANEYMGELHLKMGDLAAAERNLKVLDGACFFGCAEYDALKKAVAEYKATGKFQSSKGF